MEVISHPEKVLFPQDGIEHRQVGPRTFTLRSMARRLEDVGDLWSDMAASRCSLRGPIDRLQRVAGG